MKKCDTIKILDAGHLPNPWTGEPEPVLLDGRGNRLPRGAPPVWLEYSLTAPRPWFNSAGQELGPLPDLARLPPNGEGS